MSRLAELDVMPAVAVTCTYPSSCMPKHLVYFPGSRGGDPGKTPPYTCAKDMHILRDKIVATLISVLFL